MDSAEISGLPWEKRKIILLLDPLQPAPLNYFSFCQKITIKPEWNSKLPVVRLVRYLKNDQLTENIQLKNSSSK